MRLIDEGAKEKKEKMLALRMACLFSGCFLFFSSDHEKIVLASPLAQAAHYEEALEKYRHKKYPAALAAARRALDEDGNNAAYRHIYGLTLAALQQFREAEENLQKAIALKSAEANFHYDFGYVLYQEKKYDQAVPVLKRAVELDGENLMARFLLGRTYVSRDRKSTRLNSSHGYISYAVFCLKKKKKQISIAFRIVLK